MADSDHTAMIFIDAGRDGHILFIRRTDARALHKQGLLQKIEGKAAYCAPRNWRQIAHGVTPPLSPAVLDKAWLTPKEALQ